jgi:hypothetical protein
MPRRKKTTKSTSTANEKKSARVNAKIQPSVKEAARLKAEQEIPPKTLSAKIAELLYDYSAE